VKEEVFVVIPDNKCQNLKEARDSLEWHEWEKAIHAKLEQLKQMGTWKLVNKLLGI